MKVMMPEKERWTAQSIKALRKRLGMRVEDFAEQLRLKVDAIRSWECGRKSPSGPATLVLDALERHANGDAPLIPILQTA